MANQIQLTHVPIVILLLISSGELAHGNNRIGIFDILSKVPQYFEEPTPKPQPEPEITYECSEVSNSKAYDLLEQILTLVIEALNEMNSEACSPVLVEPVPQEPEQPYYQPYYPIWPPMMPQVPNNYGKPWGKKKGSDIPARSQSRRIQRGGPGQRRQIRAGTSGPPAYGG